ncbi:MAG: glutamate--tRNA ligase [Opitutales bacterium]
MAAVRVRFAPSPTGFFHIGSARTALFNWLYARRHDGRFILRIEDTDAERNREEYVELIYASLRWLGMNWDEGPDIGGDYGPYRQSERGTIYAEWLDKLRAAGRVYEKDGAQWFRLQGERYTEYDEYYKAEVEKVRTAPVVIHDLIRGRVERREERDFVVARADGSPTFHFVNVVDDITMGITHVVRGEDHLSNTSKHLELFQAFGVEAPIFAHLPLILKDPKVGKGKMSKRDRGALVEEYQKSHYLPAAVRNAIALLGWSPKDDREVLEIGEIIARFDLADVQKGAARFDERKMAHLNFEHLKALPLESYVWNASPVLAEAGLIDDATDEDYLLRVLALCQEKVDALANLPGFCAYFFEEAYAFDEATGAKLAKKADPAARVREALPHLEAVAASEWTVERLEGAFASLAAAHGQAKPFPWWPAVRFALSGVGSGPDFLPMLEVMGRERVLARLRRFAEEGSGV